MNRRFPKLLAGLTAALWAPSLSADPLGDGTGKDSSKQSNLGREIGALSDFFQEGLPTCGADSALVIFEQESATGEHKGDSDIAAQCVSLTDGRVIWNATRATLVSGSAFKESSAQIISDGNGGAIAVFQAEMRSGEHAGDTEIFAQRLGKSGRLEWQNGERSVVIASSNWLEQSPQIVPSEAGSFIIVYELSIQTGEHAGDFDISAKRVDINGNLLWKSDENTRIANGEGLEKSPVVVSDGQGGALVFFEAEARSGEMAGVGAILGQRIDSNGKRLWNEGLSPSPVAMTNWAEKKPSSISDGAGGAFVLFERHGLQGEHRGDMDVGAQHVDANGNTLWKNTQGIPLGDSKYLESNIQAVSDDAGGFIAVFEVAPNQGENAGNANLYGQRVNANGEAMWNNGKPLLLAASQWNDSGFQLMPDGQGGVFLVFEQHAPHGKNAGDVDLAGVRIDANGQHVWGAAERPLDLSNSNFIERAPQIIPTTDGGLAIIFEVEARTGEFTGDTEIYIHRFGPDGVKVWEKALSLASSRLLERSPVAMTP